MNSPKKGGIRVSDLNTAPENFIESVKTHGYTEGAKNATNKEHDMGVKQAITIWSPAIWWVLLVASTIVMEGYDTALMGSFFALPQFTRKYGLDTHTPKGYDIPAIWKSAIMNGALVGQIVGTFLAGILQQRYGYKKSILISLLPMKAFIFILFFAPNIGAMTAGFFLCGIPWGIFQPLATSYASEVLPVALRAYLATYINMCWLIGQLFASVVMRCIVTRPDEWAYRIPLALQWMWPVPIFMSCLWLPESPWWLIRNERYTKKQREEKARQVLIRLTKSSNPEFSVDETLDMMLHTNQVEVDLDDGVSYKDCFRGVDLRRTEVACGTWLVQTTCGSSAFIGYLAYFYQLAGLKEKNSFDMMLATYAMGMAGTVLSWFLMARAGRRTIYFWGSIALCILLFVIGSVSLIPGRTTAAAWAIASLVMFFTFCYDLTLGPVCYALVSEMSSTRLRTKTVSLARITYNIGTIIINIILAYQFSPKPKGWNWGAKSAFFWAGSCFFGIVWIFFRLPEPKKRTYAELDKLFEMKVPARRFKGTTLDMFARRKNENIAPDDNIEMDPMKTETMKMAVTAIAEQDVTGYPTSSGEGTPRERETWNN